MYTYNLIFLIFISFSNIIFSEDKSGISDNSWYGRVSASALIIRSEPSINGKILGKYLNGHRVNVLSETTQTESINGIIAPWYKVKTHAGLIGFVFGGYVEKSETMKPLKLEGASIQKSLFTDSQAKCSSRQCVEDIILSRIGRKIYRENKVLTVKCLNNKILSYKNVVDNNNVVNSIHYYVADYYETEGYYLILGQYYEGGKYILIDEKDCKNVDIADKPIFSPDKNRFICTLNGGFGYPEWNIVQIFRVGKSEILMEYEYNPNSRGLANLNSCGPGDIKWIDNSTITIVTIYITISQVGMKELSYLADLKYINDKWILSE
jgi:hypothetical protein